MEQEQSYVKHYILPGFERRRELSIEGETVADFLDRAEWNFNLPTICVVNGMPVLRRDWATTTMTHRDNILFYSKPHGSGGSSTSGKLKAVGAIVGMIALAAFAPWAAGALFTAGTFGFYATVSAITLLGGLLISTFLNSKSSNQDQQQVSQIYSLSASGNTATPYQTIPVQYGRLKVVPKYASLPWSDFVGQDSYLNVLLCAGQGKYDRHQILVDDTVLWDEDTGINTSTFSNVEIQQCNPGEPFTLFPSNVITSSEVSGQEVTTTPIGFYIVNNAGTNATRLFFDFVWPSGMYAVGSDGKHLGAAVHFKIQIQEVNNVGTPIGAIITIFDSAVGYNTVDPIRWTFAYDVSPGRYQGRVWRDPASLNLDGQPDTVIWNSFRAYLEGSNTFPCSVVGIRMKASEQLSGNSAKRFGLIQTRIIDVWDTGTSTFVEQPTRNPWWAFYDAATNDTYGAKWPVNKIDFQTILNQALAADSRGDHFDYVFESAVTFQEAFDKILKASRSKVSWLGDVLSAVRDEWKPIPNMLLSDQQIVRGSLEVEYIFNSEDSSDCIRAEFLNEDTWQPAQLQYPPDSVSFTAQQPASVELEGIVDKDHLFRELRFLWKQSQLRRIKITLDTEHDGRLLRYGTPTKIQSYLPHKWGYSGEVVSYNPTTKIAVINRTDLPTTEAGQHYVEFRSKTGGYFGPVKCSFSVDADKLLLDATDLTSVETDLGFTVVDALDRMDGAEPPSFVWGLSSELSRHALCLSGRPNGDRISLEFVVDNENVHDGTGDTIPALPTPPAYVDPRVPTIGGLTASFVQGVIEPTLSATWWPAKSAVYYKAQVSYDSGNSWTTIRDNLTDVMLREVVARADLRLRVAGVSATLQGPWATVDVSVPDIVLGPSTVNPDSFTGGLKDYIMNKLKDQEETISKILQVVASTAQEHDASRTLLAQSLRSNVSTTITAFSNFQVSYASYQVTVQASFDDLNASVTTNSTAIATLDGTVAAMYSLTLDVNGYVTGFESINDGTTSLFQIVADKFAVAQPGVSGGSVIPVFQISTVGGTAKIAFRGDMFADGTVTATALSVSDLSAITGNIGTLTTGKIQSTDGKFLIDATNKRIVISD